VRLFAVGALVQAGFGLGALLITRWGFRSWPQGSYTWIPALIALAGLAVLALVGRALSARGLPFGLIVAAWYFGRIAGVLASWLLMGVAPDTPLLATATFGVLAPGDGRPTIGTPSLLSAALPLAVLAAAYVWGKRGQVRAEDELRPKAGNRPAR
jgi:hypothetical protein